MLKKEFFRINSVNISSSKKVSGFVLQSSGIFQPYLVQESKHTSSNSHCGGQYKSKHSLKLEAGVTGYSKQFIRNAHPANNVLFTLMSVRLSSLDDMLSSSRRAQGRPDKGQKGCMFPFAS